MRPKFKLNAIVQLIVSFPIQLGIMFDKMLIRIITNIVSYTAPIFPFHYWFLIIINIIVVVRERFNKPSCVLYYNVVVCNVYVQYRLYKYTKYKFQFR